MVRDAAATRERILAAAVSEFAAHGLGGGRIDHITAASGTNPRSVYMYYGSKEALFHAAVDAALHALAEDVPLTPDDLPGFAGRSFDWLQAHPEAVRLHRWRLLEAPEAGPDDTAFYAGTVTAMRAAARPDDLPPADLLLFVSAMAATWSNTSADIRAADGRSPLDPDRIADHRAALVDAVHRLQEARPG